MNSKLIPTFPRGHIDFALSCDEIKCCVGCGRTPRHGDWYGDMAVTPTGPHPIRGLVMRCDSWCADEPEDEIIANWRRTAPHFIPIFDDVAILLVVRKHCDDEALAKAIKDTFDRVPVRSCRKIIEYACSHKGYSVTGNGMRFEALGRWPGMGRTVGMNMDSGHAVRLRASFVRQSNTDALIEVIAHELAHTEQRADEMRFDSDDECERDVEERLRSWGFDHGTTEDDKHTLRNAFDEIIRFAEEGKAAIFSGTTPSGNYASDAIGEAKRAVSAVIRASDRWQGR